jgi:hypothetical protein
MSTRIENERYTQDDFDDSLDECGDVVVCGMNFSPSHILKECDPTAYRCGFSDFQEYDEKWVCDECGEEHDDEDRADECCKETYECPCCGTEHDNEDSAELCCKETYECPCCGTEHDNEDSAELCLVQ